MSSTTTSSSSAPSTSPFYNTLVIDDANWPEDDLNQLYQQKWTRLQNIEDIVQRMEFYISQHPDGAGSTPSGTSDEELLQQIARSDTRMSHALDARDACTETLGELKLTLGDNNDEVHT